MTEREYLDKLKTLTSNFIQKIISFADFDKGRKELKEQFNSSPNNLPATPEEVIKIFGGEIKDICVGGVEPEFLK